MNSKVHNLIFIGILAASVVMIILMRKGSLMLGLFAVIPYVLVFVCMWLLLSINMLKKAMKTLYISPTDKRAETFSALLRKSFAVETFIKQEELQKLYHHIVHLPQVGHATKRKLYDAFDRKQIYVPYPANSVR